MSRSPTSSTLIGFGKVDTEQTEDKSKILHYLERLNGACQDTGDKITNLSRSRLGRAVRTH